MKISKVSKAFIWPVLATHAHAVLSDFHKALTRYSIDILEGNTQPLERTIAQISDPTSSQYGQYLSREEAFALIQPVESTVGKMKRWLRDLRIRRYEVVPFDTDAVESSFQNQVKSGTVELDCTSQMTPECLRKLYRMGDYAADPQQNTLLGIIGFNVSPSPISLLAVVNSVLAIGTIQRARLISSKIRTRSCWDLVFHRVCKWWKGCSEQYQPFR